MKEASSLLSASLAVEPTGTAYSMLGDMAFDSGDNAAAVTAYEEALTLITAGEEQATVLYQTALAELRMQHVQKAREALQRSLAAFPQHEPSLRLLRTLQGP
jgi:tetratricopeptide (TPR) repeat protein